MVKPLCCWWLIWPIQNDTKKHENDGNTSKLGTHLRVLDESYPMNTNMKRFSKILCVPVLWMNVVSAVDLLNGNMVSRSLRLLSGAYLPTKSTLLFRSPRYWAPDKAYWMVCYANNCQTRFMENTNKRAVAICQLHYSRVCSIPGFTGI